MRTLQNFLTEALNKKSMEPKISSKLNKAMGKFKKIWIYLINEYKDVRNPDTDEFIFNYELDPKVMDKWEAFITKFSENPTLMEFDWDKDSFNDYFMDGSDGFVEMWMDEDWDGIMDDMAIYLENL